MLNKIFYNTEFDSVDLSVFDWNLNAISSYKKVGFQINAGFETEMVVGNRIWRAYNMIIRKENYIAPR